VHSYYLQASSALVARTDYGRRLPVAAAKDQVIGLQFHPEKSGETGLTLLQNFVSYY
jgi:glutamine amidotransferase